VEDIKGQLDSLVKEAQTSRAAIAAAKRRRNTAAKRKQELDAKVAQLEEELQVITQVSHWGLYSRVCPSRCCCVGGCGGRCRDTYQEHFAVYALEHKEARQQGVIAHPLDAPRHVSSLVLAASVI
jgi:hypothetical protein